MGFEYFYGFVGGDTSQWQPNLFQNTTAIYPYVGKPDWNLTTAMADEAIAYMNCINALAPVQPLPYTKVGTFTQALYDEAMKQGWVVVSMKNDWKRVFAFEE